MTLALALVLVAQTAATGPAPAPAPAPAAAAAAAAKKMVPMTFQVQADAKGGVAAKAWADELRTAVEARKDEFRPAKLGEKPDVLVRVDSVAPVANGANVMNGALVVGKTPHAFNLSYKGPSAPQTEALARNLRKYAEQIKASPPAK
jgi:hypothetical protein